MPDNLSNADGGPAKRRRLADGGVSIEVRAKVIEIDADGDLKLVVGEERVTFLVDANALRRHSPVFKAMLFGNFKEAKREGDWTVELPEDNHTALEPLLNIIHANFSRLPQYVKLKDLYNMMVITEKYDLKKCFADRGRLWYSKLPTATTLPPGRSVERIRRVLRRMWIVNDLGLDKELRTVAQSLVMVLQTDKDGNLVFPRQTDEETLRNVEDESPELVDHRCLEKIVQGRLEMVISLLERTQRAYADALSLARLQATEGYEQPSCTMCQCTALGCLVKGLAETPCTHSPLKARSIALLPTPSTRDYVWSVEDLVAHIHTTSVGLPLNAVCNHVLDRSSASSTSPFAPAASRRSPAVFPRLSWDVNSDYPMKIRTMVSRYNRG